MALSLEELDIKYQKLLGDAVSGDLEEDHIAFDRILCDLLGELGLTRCIVAYNAIDKWYA